MERYSQSAYCMKTRVTWIVTYLWYQRFLPFRKWCQQLDISYIYCDERGGKIPLGMGEAADSSYSSISNTKTFLTFRRNIFEIPEEIRLKRFVLAWKRRRPQKTFSLSAFCYFCPVTQKDKLQNILTFLIRGWSSSWISYCMEELVLGPGGSMIYRNTFTSFTEICFQIWKRYSDLPDLA